MGLQNNFVAVLAGHSPFEQEEDTPLYAKILRDKMVLPA